MPRLIFINRFYWPEEPATSQLLADLTVELAAQGHEVAVITSHPGSSDIPSSEQHRGVSIIRIGGFRFGQKSIIGRIVDFLRFILGVAWFFITKMRRGDQVVFMTDPPFLAALLWPLLAVKNISFSHWVQDIYPEIATQLTGQRWLQALIPWRNLAWRKAQHCVTLGDDMASVLKRAKVGSDQIHIIPNWAPAGINASPDPQKLHELKNKWNLENKFVALYSGNLGRVHDLHPLIELADRLQDEHDIAFVFIGHGAQLESLRHVAAQRELANLYFFPPQPRSSLNISLALGDVHFVTLKEGCEHYVYPSKFHGITAAGKPILFMGPEHCGMAQLIRQRQLGDAFTSDQIPLMVNFMKQLRDSPSLRSKLSNNAIDYARQHDLLHAVEAWNQILSPHRNLAGQ